MTDLKKIAEQAQRDARRAEILRATIATLTDNREPSLLKVEVGFIGLRAIDYEPGEEIAKIIVRMWPVIWEETMRATTDEARSIEAKYASLLSEVSDHG